MRWAVLHSLCLHLEPAARDPLLVKVSERGVGSKACAVAGGQAG